VFVPWKVTGYASRVGTEHLEPWNIETWLKMARAYARTAKRRTGTIVNGKTFILDDGRQIPLGRLESRRTPDE
jgi:hypothetical protein